MIKKCIKCNEKFSSDGEVICTKCRIESHDLQTRRRDFSKNVKAWNNYANDCNSKILNKYAPKCGFKHVERMVDSNLNIHSELI